MKAEYLLFLLIFSFPAVGILWIRHKKTIRRFWKLFLPVLGTFILYCVLADPIGTIWQAWVYHADTMLGTWLWGASDETLILAVILAILFTSIVIIFAEKEEKKKPFWPFI